MFGEMDTNHQQNIALISSGNRSSALVRLTLSRVVSEKASSTIMSTRIKFTLAAQYLSSENGPTADSLVSLDTLREI
jgi:hypothetical protein